MSEYSLNGKYTPIIIESNDVGALGWIGYTIERHLNYIPSKLKPIFRKVQDDINLERS